MICLGRTLKVYVDPNGTPAFDVGHHYHTDTMRVLIGAAKDGEHPARVRNSVCLGLPLLLYGNAQRIPLTEVGR